MNHLMWQQSQTLYLPKLQPVLAGMQETSGNDNLMSSPFIHSISSLDFTGKCGHKS